jgi:hypothetical protein
VVINVEHNHESSRMKSSTRRSRPRVRDNHDAHYHRSFFGSADLLNQLMPIVPQTPPFIPTSSHQSLSRPPHA